jgi:ABC-type branched-subunit amino acid transport system ATPase component
LITRPHGFGKTTNLDMLKSFFNPHSDNKMLFEGGLYELNKDNQKINLKPLQIS